MSEEELRKTARKGDYQLAKRLLKSNGHKVDHVSFILACKSRNEKLVKLMLTSDGGRCLDRANDMPLQIALFDGSLSIVKTLLNHGFCITLPCLTAVVRNGESLSIVLFMIANRVDKLVAW